MNLFPVFNFIVQHFLQAHVHKILIFNCWNLNSQLQFLRSSNDHLLHTQMVDINRDFQFPGQHLNGMFTVLGVLLDFNCNKSGSILDKASELQLFVAKYNWLIVDENHNYSVFRKQFEDTMMSVNAQITYAGIDKKNSRESNVSFVLYDVYNNGKFLGGKLNITLDKRVTCYEYKENCDTMFLSNLHLRTKYRNRCNLNDTTFRMATVITGMPINTSQEVLMEFLSSSNNSHVDTISRYGYKLVVIFQEMMKYKLRYIFKSAWSSNETSGGAFGELALDTAELSSSPFIPTLPRLKMINIILQVGYFRSIFLFRTPRNEGLYGGVFLSPFSPPVWIAFGVVILLFAVFLWIIFAVEFRVVNYEYIKFIPSLFSTFLLSFGLACFQGAAMIPRTVGGRIAFFSLSVVTYLMYNYYTSTVVSSLVGSPLKSNIKTVGQLADSGLDIGIEPLVYTKVYLNISTSPDVKKFVRKKLKGRLDDNSAVWLKAEEGILKVRDGGYAYHAEASTAYYVVEKYYEQHELCDLNEVKLRSENSLVTLISKKSNYKEIIRLNLMRMLETGVVSKHRNYWMKTKLHCYSNSILVTVGLEYTGPLFVLLGIVYIWALMALVLEIAYHKYAIHHVINY